MPSMNQDIAGRNSSIPCHSLSLALRFNPRFAAHSHDVVYHEANLSGGNLSMRQDAALLRIVGFADKLAADAERERERHDYYSVQVEGYGTDRR